MNIQKFSKLTGLSSYTLRYYEKIGLFEVIRDVNGHRTFSRKDAKWIACIKRLKDTHMPLNEIKAFAGMRHQCKGPDYKRLQILETHQIKLNEERKALAIRQEKIDREILLYKNWNNITSR